MVDLVHSGGKVGQLLNWNQGWWMEKKKIYKISFYNEESVYEIYAEEIAESNLFGFIEVESIVFGTKSAVVIDPSEEKLKAEFSHVKRSYIPMQSIIRIDEVDKEGVPKIRELSRNPATVSHLSLYPKKNPTSNND